MRSLEFLGDQKTSYWLIVK